MISQVLAENKKYFPCSEESGVFTIETDGVSIAGTFSQTYLVGQYLNIYGSILNDGVYKITAVTSAKLTLDATLLAEATDNTLILFGLAVPQPLLAIIADIETYMSQQAVLPNIKRESQGGRDGREVEYMNGSTWQGAFMTQLIPYRAVYDDRFSSCNRSYNPLYKR